MLIARAEAALAAERKARVATEAVAENFVSMDRAVQIAIQAEGNRAAACCPTPSTIRSAMPGRLSDVGDAGGDHPAEPVTYRSRRPTP